MGKSIHSEAAKAIRSELKTNFPNTKFSVRSRSYSGGNSVDIDWTDGPTFDTVMKIVCKYEYGTFDGMQDMYVHDNSRNDIPQVKYVLCHRNRSIETMEKVVARINENWGTDIKVVPTPYGYDIPEIEEARKRFGCWTSQFVNRYCEDNGL